LGGELDRLLEPAQRLLQIDDVDAVPLAEDEGLHLRVPALRLVAEVRAGLQEVLDGHRGQEPISVVTCLLPLLRPFRLALRELEALPGALLAVLLALLGAWISREEPRGPKPLPELRVPLEQGARETVADGAGLSGDPSAGNVDGRVEL